MAGTWRGGCRADLPPRFILDAKISRIYPKNWFLPARRCLTWPFAVIWGPSKPLSRKWRVPFPHRGPELDSPSPVLGGPILWTPHPRWVARGDRSALDRGVRGAGGVARTWRGGCRADLPPGFILDAKMSRIYPKNWFLPAQRCLTWPFAIIWGPSKPPDGWLVGTVALRTAGCEGLVAWLGPGVVGAELISHLGSSWMPKSAGFTPKTGSCRRGDA